MRQSVRALAESFFLHGLIAGMLIITAGMLKTPPKTIRLDVSLLEQVAAPLRQVPPPVPKTVVPDPEPVAQPQPVPKPQPKVAPFHPKKIKKSIPKPKTIKSAPTPVPKVQEAPRQAVASPVKPTSVSAETRNRPQISAGSQDKATARKTSKLRNYLGIIRLRIEREKRYPLWARSHRLEGEVSVRFILSPDGQVSAVSVSKSSGQGCLDEAAMDAVRQASPMPPSPEGVLSEAIPMELTIVFKLT